MLGIHDGPAQSATFLVPSGIAVGRDGTIYVSDEAAQRIRAIKNGIVSTVAGGGELGSLGLSVIGGDVDGPALSARFNHPMGLAVGPNGALYIADAKNKKIRKLEHGVVTTVVSGLTSPRDVAFDRSGNLWIADFGGGLKRWDGHKLTSIALSLKDHGLLSLSVSPDADDPTVMAVTPGVVFEYHINTGSSSYVTTAVQEGGRVFGTPRQIVALGKHQALFSDPVADNVRYLRFAVRPYQSVSYTLRLVGGQRENAIENVGFRDGTDARFYSPRGLVAVNGRVIVADSGNRRVREFDLPHFRTPEWGLEGASKYDNTHYEIALVGASITFWDSHDDTDSICGAIERRLNTSHAISKPVRCHTIRIDGALMPPIESYLNKFLLFEHVDAYVLLMQPGAAGWFPGAGGPGSAKSTDQGVSAFRASLRPLIAGTKSRWLAVWWAENYQVSDNEDLAERQINPVIFPDEMFNEHLRLERLTMPALFGLPRLAQYDLFWDMVRYEKANGAPLFSSGNPHLNARGNVFVGNHIANALLRVIGSP